MGWSGALHVPVVFQIVLHASRRLRNGESLLTVNGLPNGRPQAFFSMTDAAPSQIPVSVKRRSMGPSTPMGPPPIPGSSSSNALNGRATSPLAMRPPSTHGSRRHSLIPASRSRQASLNDATLDDPGMSFELDLLASCSNQHSNPPRPD